MATLSLGVMVVAVQIFQGVDFVVFRDSNESPQLVGIETRKKIKVEQRS